MDIARERAYPTPLANSPLLLPLMLLSLARQKNAPTNIQTVSSISSEYDYVIVGSGSAGSTLAARLSEKPCVNILLLEAGGSPPILTDVPGYTENFLATDINWGYQTVPQRHTAKQLIGKRVPWPGGKGLGGTSLINVMLYVRGTKKNYDDWAAQGATGWSYEDVLPYFLKAEGNRNKEVVAHGFHGTQGPLTVEKPEFQPIVKAPILEAARELGFKVQDINGANQTGFPNIQATFRGQQRCSTAKAYLVPAEKRKNLHILTNALVTKIIIENHDGKKKAVGVLFDVNNKSYAVAARKEVIMSAGTPNTAQILMLSGIGPKKELKKHGIPLVADLPVGENLQDHPVSFLSYVVNSTVVPPPLQQLTDKQSVIDYINNRTGPLTSISLLAANGFSNTKSVHAKEDNPYFQTNFAEVPTEFGSLGGLTPEANKQVFEPYKGQSLFGCFTALLRPKSRGSVKLNSSDPYDPPLIDPNYFADPKDLDFIAEGMILCRKIGESKAMQKLGTKPFNTTYPGCEKYFHGDDEKKYYKCVAQAYVSSLGNQVGTSKMGNPKDPTTVVDPELRVKGIGNLRVVDAGVMPIIPSGLANSPTIMIAEKAADMIKGGIKSCPPVEIPPTLSCE